MTVGVAIVGCGAVTRIVHVPVLGMLADLARVVAVCDPDAQRASEVARLVGGAKTYARLDDVLGDPDVEAVDICTPHALHAALTARSKRGGTCWSRSLSPPRSRMGSAWSRLLTRLVGC